MKNTAALNGASMSAVARASSAPMQSAGARLPLSLVHAGETVTVVKVRGNEKFIRRFAELGFVPGAEVKVVSSSQGNIVVIIKGSQFGLDHETALRVMTC